MKKILIALLCLIINNAVAQQKKTDSLVNVLRSAKEDTVKVNILVKLTSTLSQSNPVAALQYGRQAIALGQKLKFNKGLAKAYNWTGIVYAYTGQKDSALKYFQISRTLAHNAGMKTEEIKDIANIGLIYSHMAQYDKALEYSMLGLKMNREAGQTIGVAKSLTSIGLIYSKLGDINKELDYYQQALKIHQDAKDSENIGIALISIGTVYNVMNRYDDALKTFYEALRLCRKLDNKYNEAICLSNIAQSYQYKKQWEDAIKYYHESLVIERQNDLKSLELMTLGNTGGCYLDQKQYDTALKYFNIAITASRVMNDKVSELTFTKDVGSIMFEKNNIDKALALGRQSLKIAQDINDPDDQKEAWLLISRCLEKKGKPGEALTAYKNYITLRDSLMNSDKAKELMQKDMQFSFNMKEAKNKAEQDKKDLEAKTALNEQNQQRNIFIAALILAIILAIFIYVNYRKQTRLNKQVMLEKEKSEELGKLKDKLFSIISHDMRSPLVNTQSLLELMNRNQIPEEKLKKYTAALSENLENNIQLLDNLLSWAASQVRGLELRKTKVDIKDLIEENIFAIQSAAEKKNIIISENTHQETAIADISMARLVMRNLLSNALKYTPDGGTIKVMAEKEGQAVKISVADTGVGMDEGQKKRVFSTAVQESKPGTRNEKGFGIGLQLCREFVEKNGGTISVESEPGKGSTFSFTLPLAA